MTKVINGEKHYEVVGGAGKYYINENGDVYSIRINDYLSRNCNQVRLSINGVFKKYNCKNLLIEALINTVNELTAENKGLCECLMHYYK